MLSDLPLDTKLGRHFYHSRIYENISKDPLSKPNRKYEKFGSVEADIVNIISQFKCEWKLASTSGLLFLQITNIHTLTLWKHIHTRELRIFVLFFQLLLLWYSIFLFYLVPNVFNPCSLKLYLKLSFQGLTEFNPKDFFLLSLHTSTWHGMK